MKQNSEDFFSAVKMSKIIEQFAADYISMGETTEERQNYLNSACTAWNIAVLPEHERSTALHFVVNEYKKHNPDVDDADAFLENLQTLIRKKLEMFPAVKKVIVNAFLEKIEGTTYRVSVVSTDRE